MIFQKYEKRLHFIKSYDKILKQYARSDQFCTVQRKSVVAIAVNYCGGKINQNRRISQWE